MANDALLVQAQEYLQKLKEFEQELNSQLKELNDKVDTSFGQMSEMVTAITDLAVESTNGLVSNETRSQIAFAGQVLSGVVNTAGRVYQTYKHNQYLNKLLAMKREIADAKQGTIKRILPRIEKNNESLKQLLVNAGKKKYALADLSNVDTCNQLVDNMDKFLDLFRTSEYLRQVALYLDAEYTAWLDGDQRSDIEQPDYFDANRAIVKLLEDASKEKANEVMTATLDAPAGTISGSTIYYLMDSQLSAYVLKTVYPIRQLSLPDNAGIRSLISGNAGIEHYKATTDRLAALMEKGCSKVYFTTIPMIVLAIILIVVFWKSLAWYWILAILAGALGIGVWGDSINSDKEKAYAEELSCLKAKVGYDAQRDAGYVYREKQDLEKKSYIKAAFGSFFS